MVMAGWRRKSVTSYLTLTARGSTKVYPRTVRVKIFTMAVYP